MFTPCPLLRSADDDPDLGTFGTRSRARSAATIRPMHDHNSRRGASWCLLRRLASPCLRLALPRRTHAANHPPPSLAPRRTRRATRMATLLGQKATQRRAGDAGARSPGRRVLFASAGTADTPRAYRGDLPLPGREHHQPIVGALVLVPFATACSASMTTSAISAGLARDEPHVTVRPLLATPAACSTRQRGQSPV